MGLFSATLVGNERSKHRHQSLAIGQFLTLFKGSHRSWAGNLFVQNLNRCLSLPCLRTWSFCERSIAFLRANLWMWKLTGESFAGVASSSLAVAFCLGLIALTKTTA